MRSFFTSSIISLPWYCSIIFRGALPGLKPLKSACIPDLVSWLPLLNRSLYEAAFLPGLFPQWLSPCSLTKAVVRERGIEPLPGNAGWILNPVRLPVPPLSHPKGIFRIAAASATALYYLNLFRIWIGNPGLLDIGLRRLAQVLIHRRVNPRINYSIIMCQGVKVGGT
jgi:hypothetical protein